MGKFLNILIILVVIILLAITVVAKAQETSNVLNNGSFDGGTDGWILSGTASFDGKDYQNSQLSEMVRFSGSDGGAVAQSVTLGNINSDTKYISKVHGSIKSYGCNNSSGEWCNSTGTDNNLDPVNTTLTFNDGTQTEVLQYNFTSDYNDGIITSSFTINLEQDFNIDNTSISVNVFGADKGDGIGRLGSIIDDLSLTLTLADLVIAQQTEIAEISQVGSLDATSIVDTLSSGVIDMHSTDDIEIANLSTAITGISNIQDMNMDMNMAEINQMPEVQIVNSLEKIEVETEINMPTQEMPDIQMPDIQMPDIQMNDLPEINDIQIESVNEPEPETLQEMREEIPENNIEELPAELEQTDMEEDLKENQNEQQEETSTENEEVDGANEESELSDDSSTEEKEPKEKVNEEKESEEKEETAEEEIKDEPSANEEKVVKTAKSSKSEKKQGSESQNKNDKKTSVSIVTPKIKSDIVVQEIDIKTIVSFNKEYFEVKITDTLDLTTTEIDFYDGQDGFNNQDYAKANSNFFNQYSDTNSEWDLVSKRDVIKIEQFRR